ncbi:MAG TPA: hypothetical protein VIL94_07280 [Acidothermaceae bacterium]
MMRTAFRARWLPRHALAVVLIAALSLLGRWQWDVSYSERGSLQNLLYAFQWWVMAAMVGYAWWRLLHDEAHGRTPRIATTKAAIADDAAWPTANAAASMPANTTLEPDDELDEYNAYLAQLNARSEGAR